MTETKHTPLPFGITTSNTQDEIFLFGENHDGDCYIGMIQGDVGLQGNQENARFIVKACNSHYELLESLKAILDWCDKSSPCVQIQNAVAAIAKVEGK